MDASFQPGKQELQSVPLLNLSHQLISRELAACIHDETLYLVLNPVHIQETAHNHRETRGVHLKAYQGRLNQL
jgi:hypothetical protein